MKVYGEKILLQRAKAHPQYPEKETLGEPWEETRQIGHKLTRVDGYERICGAAAYPSDVVLPNMLYAAILTCPYANARVKKVHTSRAKSIPGLAAVLCKDSPEADLKWPYSESYTGKLFDTHCRFEGEAVAAAAADSPYAAWDALRAIKVDYQVLDFVSEAKEALSSRSSKVHPEGNMVSPVQTYERGDVQKGFAQADVVMEQEYQTQTELHTPIELHGCVASWDGDRLTIWESTQGVYAVQEKVAQVLDMPRSKVRVIGHYVGGGFGSKLETSKYSIIAALLARKTGKPVKLFLPREQTYLSMGNRPGSYMKIKLGAKSNGSLTAIEFTGLAASGAYPADGTSLLDWLAKDMYLCPNVRTELTDVYINAGPARPFRAPGYPQCSWAVEQMMDALAEKLNMDPVDLRLKNFTPVSQARKGGPPYTSNGLKECIQEGAKAFKWQESRRYTASQSKSLHLRRGVGMAACNWFVGGGWPPSTVVVKLFEDGSVNLNMGASDIGTGTKTVMAMIAAEELGVEADSVQIENADTGTTQYASPSGGSKTVPTEGPAVREAALSVKNQLISMAARDLETDKDSLLLKNGRIQTRDGSKKISLSDLSDLKEQKVVMAVGHKRPNPEDKAVTPFGAQYCEVEVNALTGEFKILRFVACHESGKVLDLLTFYSQIIGGVTMGIGLGATEGRVLDKNRTGKLCNRNWHDYKLPTMLDVPDEFSPLAIDLPDYEANITGAKGLGEPVTIPTAAAIANAIYNAVGIRMNSTPINPVTLVSKLADKG